MGAIDKVFDTNILIDHLRGIPQALNTIASSAARGISIITWIEIMAGVNDSNDASSKKLLERFIVLPITMEIAGKAAKIRSQSRVKLPDAIIHATAQVSGCSLVTRNTRDFAPGSPGVLIPYTL